MILNCAAQYELGVSAFALTRCRIVEPPLTLKIMLAESALSRYCFYHLDDFNFMNCRRIVTMSWKSAENYIPVVTDSQELSHLCRWNQMSASGDTTLQMTGLKPRIYIGCLANMHGSYNTHLLCTWWQDPRDVGHERKFERATNCVPINTYHVWTLSAD